MRPEEFRVVAPVARGLHGILGDICLGSEVSRLSEPLTISSARAVDLLDHLGGRPTVNDLAHRAESCARPVHDDYPPRTIGFIGEDNLAE
jgi:hypothetical protein